MTFSTQLRPLVERLGTSESARLCGVTPRSIQLWLAQPEKPPCRAMQIGVIHILSRRAKYPLAITRAQLYRKP